MSNKTKKNNSGLMAVLIVFAVIGVISVVGAGVFGVTRLVKTVSDKAEVPSNEVDASPSPQEVLTIELEKENAKPDSGEAAKGGSNEAETFLSEEDVPEILASVEEDRDVHEDGKFQIVVLGDSVYDNFRDETGIAYKLATELDANVYNLAIGGTAASVPRDYNYYSDESLSETCGMAVAKIIAGRTPIDAIYDCTAKSIIRDNMDKFKDTDLFIVEYGINDFLAARDQNNPDDNTDPRTYEGALRHILNALKEVNPDAKILLCAPSYVEFYRPNGEYIGNSNNLNNGLGTLRDFGNKMEYVSGDYGAYFFPLDSQGLGFDNSYETMLDDVHPNEKGREIYAANLIDFIKTNILHEE